MKVVEGWRRIDNERGYMNVATGQNLVVTKGEFGEHYSVMLFPMMKNDKEEGMKISPEFATRSKAETLAMDWMNKHPKGVEQTLKPISPSVISSESLMGHSS